MDRKKRRFVRRRLPAVLLAVLLCSCSTVRTTQELNSALVGKSRAEVAKYFGRKPDEDHGQTSQVYYGDFADPAESTTYRAAVVVFSHFEPDTVWSVGFTGR